MSIMLTEYIRVTYDGHTLRTYLNGKPSTECPAELKECYYINPNGLKKAPSVVKAEMPQLRGQKIAWCLAFSNKKALCSSFEEYSQVVRSYKEKTHQDVMFSVKKDVYAIAFVKNEKEKKLLKPLAAYVSPTINSEELEQLIKDFTYYRPLFCPVEFLRIL